MIDSKTTFLLKWAGFEDATESQWVSNIVGIQIGKDVFRVYGLIRENATQGSIHESTPEAINRDLQNFLKKYMRGNGIEPPPKLTDEMKTQLIAIVDRDFYIPLTTTTIKALKKRSLVYNFAKATEKGRILADFLKEKD